MTQSSNSKILNYSAQQMFDLVADVEKYPQFIPWCKNITIISRSPTEIINEMSVGFAMFSEQLRTVSKLTPNSLIEIEYISGPFEHLNSTWEFHAIQHNKCQVNFNINFQAKGYLIKTALELSFLKANQAILKSFTKRAQEIYS